jgi:hypothetical protein
MQPPDRVGSIGRVAAVQFSRVAERASGNSREPVSQNSTACTGSSSAECGTERALGGRPQKARRRLARPGSVDVLGHTVGIPSLASLRDAGELIQHTCVESGDSALAAGSVGETKGRRWCRAGWAPYWGSLERR